MSTIANIKRRKTFEFISDEFTVNKMQKKNQHSSNNANCYGELETHGRGKCVLSSDENQ